MEDREDGEERRILRESDNLRTRWIRIIFPFPPIRDLLANFESARRCWYLDVSPFQEIEWHDGIRGRGGREERGQSGELENGSFNFNLNSSYLTFGHRNLSLYSIRPFSSSSSSSSPTGRKEARAYVYVYATYIRKWKKATKKGIKRGYSAREGSFLPHG